MLIIFLAFAIAAIPLILAGTTVRSKRGRKMALIANIVMIAALSIGVFAFGAASVALADDSAAATAATAAAAAGQSVGSGIGLLGAGLATGLSCVGAGIAVGPTAAAAIGAMTENPKTFGRALIFVVIAEGIALYGMLISFQVLSKL